MSLIYAAEMTAWDLVEQTETTWYFSSAGLVTGPTDTPAHTAFDPRIQQPALMRRDLFDSGRTFGASKIGYGELTLINNDGALDRLLDYALDGRALILRVGEAGTAYPDAWTLVLRAIMDAPRIERHRVSIRLRDPQQAMDKNLQANTYTGENALPDGLEGTENDLKGRPKPLIYGVVKNITPPIVNTSRLIYQLHDGELTSVDAVYDQGVALTAEGAYADQNELETTVPSAGCYRPWLSGGYLRLGSRPVGTLTVDATQGDAAARTAAQILSALAERAGIASEDLDSADVSALDTACSAELGLWLNAETTALAAMDAVANSIGAWYGFDPLGHLRMAQMTMPDGAPAATIDADSILEIELQATATGDTNIPPSQIDVRYARNWTPQEGSNLAGSVSDERRAWLAEEWRTVTASGASVIDHPLADTLTMDTLLIQAVDAQAEADRRATLFVGRRDRVAVLINLNTVPIASLELGRVVQITLPRFGYDAGKLFRIIGILSDLRLGRAELILWG